MRTHEKLVILIILAGLSTAVFSVVTSFTMPAVAQDPIRIFGIDTPEKRQN